MFTRDNVTSLSNVIQKALEGDNVLSKNAYITYKSLLTPTMAEKLIYTMNPYINKGL